MKFIYINDTTTLNPAEVPKDMKDFLTQNTSPSGGRVLRVKVAATHSGRPTKNNMLYLPQNMANSVDTWLTPFAKPILVHHDSYTDPIGRVSAARYIDTSALLRDRFSDFTLINDAKKESVSPVLFDAFIAGKLSIRETVDLCNTKLFQDAFDDENFPGLGYIELTMDIINPEAAQKVLDGRYLTGSTSAATTRAVCSICKTDWISEDICEHEPGQTYDGVKCILIAGDFKYSEYSFVNKPADSLSQVLSIGDETGENLKDCVGCSCRFASSLNKTMLIYDSFQPIKQIVEDFNMKTLTLEEAVKLLLKDGINREENAVEAAAVLKYIEDNKLFACDPCEAKDVFLTVYAELYPTQQVETADATNTNPVKVFFADEYEELVGDDEWGTQYAEMIFDALHSEDTELVGLIKDAKLSSKVRKALPKSTFCKPPSGYPVNNCAHAKAAMAYAKKNNEASSVVSCIRRKAARLGCPFKDEAVTVGQFTTDYFDSFEDTEMRQLALGLAAVLKERNILTVLDNKELTIEVNTLKDENKKLQEELQQIEDLLVVRTKEIKDLTIERIVDLKCLVQEEIKDINTLFSNFNDKTLEECNIVLEDYNKKVDRPKIQEKIITGLGNVAQGTVINPLHNETNIDPEQATVAIADNTSNIVAAAGVEQILPDTKKKELTNEDKQNVLNRYFQIRLTGTQKDADDYIANVRNQGYNVEDILK